VGLRGHPLSRPGTPGQPAGWESAGRRVASALDGAAAVVVVGDDADTVAAVATGIARLQAFRRHVALGDLLDDSPALRALAPGDDPHGLADVFLYGVSMNRIARQADASGNLHLLPSGSGSVRQEEILASDRWRRLAGGFREEGALLLLAATRDTPGLPALVTMLDGVVLVGAADVPADGVRVLARVETPVAARRAPRRRDAAPASARRAPVIAAVALLVLGALGAAAWWQREPLRRLVEERFGAADRALPAPAPFPPPAPTPTPADSAPGSAAVAMDSVPLDTTPVLVVANPEAEREASAWTVELVAMNTIDGAMLRVLDEARLFPAATFSPVTLGGGAVWYKVMAGAWPRRGPADSLLTRMRSSGQLTPGAGVVVRAPLALRITSGATRVSAPALVETFRSRGVPAYALLLSDGTVSIYAGAFESATQAARLASLLRSANIESTLVYRVGRVF
jgi:hypothetical protein